MSALGDLQGRFQDFLLRGAAGVEADVLGTERVPAATRLGIYAGAYRSRLAEALETNYPALARLLGPADFGALAADYIAAHDSTGFSIRTYGDALAAFLAAREEYAAAPVLAELASWEWAMAGVFDAADAAPLAVADLAQLPPADWARLRFACHPAVTRLTLAWNAPQLWQALTRDEASRPEPAYAVVPVEWLLWRQGLASYFRSLGAAEAAALDALRSGAPFGEICALLGETLGDEAAASEAARLLRGWIEAGLIVRLS